MNELRIGDIIRDALEREDLQLQHSTSNIQTHERVLHVCYTRHDTNTPCFKIVIQDVTHVLPDFHD